MMRLVSVSIVALSLSLLLGSCQPAGRQLKNAPRTDLTKAGVVPLPLSMVSDGGAFPLDQYTIIETDGENGFAEVADFLSKEINAETGLKTGVNPKSKPSKQTIISIKEVKDESLSDESYQLRITTDSVSISSATATGAYWAVQTLRQLIPHQSIDTLDDVPIWIIPTGVIDDTPRFSYRGTMLDVARHFFSVEDVKKYIDMLSYYKINALHLHLTDDQGWRIEIKSWPNLAKVGGLSEVGGGKGGYFTQADYAEIVDYAAQHHMLIIPEIDMPGHTNAASVSYPILNGNGKIAKPYTGMRVGFSTLDTRKDTVYAFIDDVIREIAALTPGPYIHIGGDESHVTKEKDYRYFVERVEKIVSKYDKRMIGWDEVANTDASSKTVTQVWRSTKNANTAVAKDMDIILSIAQKAYLDMKYDSLSKHGLTWAGYVPVDTAYMWDPSSYVSDENLMGIEAPLWSETISNISELEYLAFPRVIGYAEIGWSTQKRRNWEDYKRRLSYQRHYLNKRNVNYYRAPQLEGLNALSSK